MPDRTFTIVFNADNSAAIHGMKALANEFRMLEAYVSGAGGPMAGVTQQLNNMAGQAQVTTDILNGAGHATRGLGADLIKMGAAMAVFEGGMAAIQGFADVANKARDRIKELAEETMGLRDEMRELANLKGAQGPDNEIAGETVKMGMEAGMLPKDMVKYLEQFEGSIPAGEQKGHIDEKTKQQLAVEGAKFGARVQLAPQTAGDLAGVIPQYTDLTKDENGKALPQDQRLANGMAQMGRVVYGLNEGRGKVESLARSLINTAGAVVEMGGPVEDLGELAAIQGVASTHANPRESGTRVRQAVRALRDTGGSAGGFLTKTAGIVDTDTHIQRLEKVKKQVDIARKNGKPVDKSLMDAGFTDQDENRAIREQIQDLDIIKGRIAKGKAQITGKGEIKKDEDFLTKERVGIRRRQLARKAGGEFLIGENAERLEMAKENAEQNMRNDHQIGGVLNGAKELVSDGLGLFPLLGAQKTRERWKADRATRKLVQEAGRVGIGYDEAGTMMGLEKSKESGRYEYDNMTEAQRLEGFNKLATEVERRGGNSTGTGPDLNPKFDALITETRETNRILRARQPGAAGPPAAPAPAPAPPPMRRPAAPARP